jgi:hypothetical protein
VRGYAVNVLRTEFLPIPWKLASPGIGSAVKIELGQSTEIDFQKAVKAKVQKLYGNHTGNPEKIQ